MKNVVSLSLLAGLIGVICANTWAHKAEGGKILPTRIFELRTYYAHPGKMPELNARFRDHTNKLFVKHGMTLIGYWNPLGAKEADEKLIYILAHANKDAAAKSWDDFRKDPDWNAAKTKSEANGPLVAKIESVFMSPTDYSPLK